MPRPVPLALVVKNGSKTLLVLGAEPRAVVADGDRGARAGLRARVLVHRISTRPGGAGGQGVVQDVAEDLLEPERVRDAVQVDAIDRLAKRCVPPGGARLQVRPGLAPDQSQVAGRTFQLDRRRVAADVLVERGAGGPGPSGSGRSGPAPRAGRRRPGRASRGRPGCAAGRCGSRGQPGDHLADGGQPLGLQRSLLRLLEERDVVADRQHTGLAAGAFEGPVGPSDLRRLPSRAGPGR